MGTYAFILLSIHSTLMGEVKIPMDFFLGEQYIVTYLLQKLVHKIPVNCFFSSREGKKYLHSLEFITTTLYVTPSAQCQLKPILISRPELWTISATGKTPDQTWKFHINLPVFK